MHKRVSVVWRMMGAFIILSILLSVFPAVGASASGGLASKPWITDDSLYWNSSEAGYSGRESKSGWVTIPAAGGRTRDVSVVYNYTELITDVLRFRTWIDNNHNYYMRVNPRGGTPIRYITLYDPGDPSISKPATTLDPAYDSVAPYNWMSHEVNNALVNFGLRVDKLANSRDGGALRKWYLAVSAYDASEKTEDDLKKLNDVRSELMDTAFWIDDSIVADADMSMYLNTYDEAISVLERECASGYPLSDSAKYDYAKQANTTVAYFSETEGAKVAIAQIKLMKAVALALYESLEEVEISATIAGVASVEEGKTGSVEKGFSELLRGIGRSLQNILAKHNTTMDSIVYGRVKTVGGSPVLVNNYSFELADGNVYGVVGAVVFNILRGLLLLSLVLVTLFQLVKGSFANSARAIEQVKDNILYSIIAVGLLAFLPQIVHLLIYCRDWFLSVLAPSIKELAKGDGDIYVSLSSTFLLQAEREQTFVTACEYLGVIAITVYFAFIYVSMACSMTILFAFSPLFILLSFKNRRLLDDWFMFVIGVMVTPLIDAMLFILPMLASSSAFNTPTLVQFILCMSLIPARATIRTMLGMGRSVGSELLGAGALLMAGRAIGGLARTARNIAGTAAGAIGGAISDSREAKTLEDLSQTEESVNGVRRDKYDYALEKQNEIGEGDFSTISETEGGRAGGGSGAGGFQLPHYGAEFEASLDPETDLRAHRQGVLDRHASVANLDSPLMRDMSPAKRAELLRSRARRNLVRGGLKTVGMAGGAVAGGAVGFGATTFMSPAARIMGTAGGAIIGSELGNAAGSLTYAAGSGVVGLGNKAMGWASNRAGGDGSVAPGAAGVGGVTAEGVLGGEPVNTVPAVGTEDFSGAYYDEPIGNVTPEEPDTLEPTDVRIQDGRGEVLLFNNMQAVSMTDEQLQNELTSLSNDMKASTSVDSWRNLDNDEFNGRAARILNATRLSGNQAQFMTAVNGIGDIVNRNSGLMAKGYKGSYTNSCKMGRTLSSEIDSAVKMAKNPANKGAFNKVLVAHENGYGYIGQQTRSDNAYEARLQRAKTTQTAAEQYYAEARENAGGYYSGQYDGMVDHTVHDPLGAMQDKYRAEAEKQMDGMAEQQRNATKAELALEYAAQVRASANHADPGHDIYGDKGFGYLKKEVYDDIPLEAGGMRVDVSAIRDSIYDKVNADIISDPSSITTEDYCRNVGQWVVKETMSKYPGEYKPDEINALAAIGTMFGSDFQNEYMRDYAGEFES